MKLQIKKFIIFAVFIFLFPAHALPENIDRVVAFIDDTAITKRELDNQHSRDRRISPSITREQTLEAMINTALMLREASKLRLSARDDAQLLNKYLDLKIRAVILVSDKDVAVYFNNNRARLGNKSFRDIKGDIRILLEELKYNQILSEHINTLRTKARIKILD